jgi:hypothetical protein
MTSLQSPGGKYDLVILEALGEEVSAPEGCPDG